MPQVNLREAFKGAKTPGDIRTAANKITALMQDGKIKKEDLSVRNIAEATLGREALEQIAKMNDEGSQITGLQEAVDPVNLSAFTNITGQLIIQGAYEAFRAPEFVGDQLVAPETSREDNTRVPGLAPIDDDVLEVKEGAEYPDMKFSEDYIDVPGSKKRGAKIGLTREMIFFDRTGQLLDLAQGIGTRLGVDKERRILAVFIGNLAGTAQFTRNGVARNTYVASADPRINKLASTSLTDWTTIDTVWQLFQNMTDDRTTGEPIMVQPDTLVCCPGKEFTARRILQATEVRTTTNTNTNTYGANPIASVGLKVITSQWLAHMLMRSAAKGGSALSATNANDVWFVGQPKKAFRYRTIFPFALRAAKHDKDEFDRDVLMQWRCEERGVAYVYAPWYNVKVYNAAE